MAQVEFEVPGPGTYLIEAEPSLPALSNPGQASDVLAGEQFYDEDGNPVTGTMPSNPTEAIVIPGGGSYTIPQGYHTGQGTVTSSGSALPTLTNPAAAGEIASGKEVIDQNGAVMTGTMPSNPAISETLEAGESYQVPAGYTPGGTVQAASLASQTPGTATQDDIIQGQTAWVNGVQVTGALEPGSDTSDATATAADILEGETAYIATGKVSGTMPNNGAVQETLQAGGQYTIPAGYHNGQGTVTAETLANQTQGTATAPDILNGETAWVNGAQVTGSMPDNGAVTKEMTAGETYNIPAGYHNGSGTVTAPTVASETPGTAVAGDIRQGKTAWVAGEQLTGTVPDVEAATPTISVSPEGLITAQTEQTAGYVAEATKAASQQLQMQGAQTITPGTTAQTIQANVYLTGAQTIQGDANLVPGNIKEDVSIFGVTGTYAGDGGDFAVPLTVTVDSGATVTAVNGDTKLTATSVDRTANFTLTSGGQWEITAELDGRIGQSTVSVESSYSTAVALPSSVQVFGVAWDTTNPSTALTRLTAETDPNAYVTENISSNPSPAVGTGAGSSPFDAYLPWSGMYICNLNAAGEETAKQGDQSFSYSTADVMIYIPLFYYRIEEVENTRYFYISNGQREGFSLHPGSGKYVARYNTSAEYSSVTGTAPLVNITRSTARTQSRAKGAGWDGYDYMTWCAVWLLYLVEFADWNSQEVIGAGITDASAIQNNGGTDAMTYHTGRAAGTDNLSAVQYRGIENLWGNVHDCVDGTNFNDRAAYICTNPDNYADDTTSNYTAAGVTLPILRIKGIGLSSAFTWAFLPDDTGGSWTTYIPDSLYSQPGWREFVVGGYHSNGTDAGLFYFNANFSSSNANPNIGARLLFRP